MTRSDEPSRNARDQLFSAALQLFDERGFHATSIREITGRCGLTVAAFYIYFPSKQDLLYDIVLDAQKSVRESIERSLEAVGAGNLERIWALSRGVALYVGVDPLRARVVEHNWHALEGNHLAEIRRMRRSNLAVLSEMIDRGLDEGSIAIDGFDPSADGAIERLGSLISGMVVSSAEWFRTSGPIPPENFSVLLANLAVRMLAAPGQPLPSFG